MVLPTRRVPGCGAADPRLLSHCCCRPARPEELGWSRARGPRRLGLWGPPAPALLFLVPTKQPVCSLCPHGCCPRSQPHCHLFFLAGMLAIASKWPPCLQSCPFHPILYTEGFSSDVSPTRMKALWWSLNSEHGRGPPGQLRSRSLSLGASSLVHKLPARSF